MAVFRVVRAGEGELAEARLNYATARAGIRLKWYGVGASIAAGDVVLIGDVADGDPDSDLFLWFHREVGDPARTIWVRHLWGRSVKLLRIFEAACKLMGVLGVVFVRWAYNPEMPYSVRAAQVTNAALSADGTYWEVPVAQALTLTQARIALEGTAPL